MLEQSWGQVADDSYIWQNPLPQVLVDWAVGNVVGWADGLSEGFAVGEEVVGLLVGILEGDAVVGRIDGFAVAVVVVVVVVVFESSNDRWVLQSYTKIKTQ